MSATDILPPAVGNLRYLERDEAASVPDFVPFEPEGSRVVHGEAFPLALTLADHSKALTLDSVNERIKQYAQDGTIRDLLNKHGAIFFRGLPLTSRDDLSRFVEAFQFRQEHQEIGLSGQRSQVTKHIQTASELPGTIKMNFHNEYARSNHFPEILFFYSEIVPKQGGQTPILSSTELYDRVLEELPQFVHDLASKGVIGRQYYPSKADPEAKEIGWNWQDSFGFNITPDDSLSRQHEKVENILKDELQATAEWQPNGALHVLQHVPAIRRIKSSDRPTFFNGLAGVYGSALRDGALEPPHKIKNGPGYKLPSTYGDGSPIPNEYLDRLIEIQDQIAFLVPWKESDVVVVNNYTVQHSRTTFEGKRSVLAPLVFTRLPATLLNNAKGLIQQSRMVEDQIIREVKPWKATFENVVLPLAHVNNLLDYDAGYYGYLYSQVFADDMFHSAFKADPMDAKQGRRYRYTVLEKDGSQDEMKTLMAFLGRKPSSDAVYQELGIASN